MNKEIMELKRKFEEVKKKGWVSEKNNYLGDSGNVFESLLNKERDNFSYPDYYGIEIKTIKINSRGKIHLLNLTPDGDYLYPIKRILDNLGYPDKNNPKYRVFNVEIAGDKYKKLCYGKKIILKVNYNDEKIELIGYDFKNQNINIGISWSFDLLKNRVMNKLKYLAIVKAQERIVNGTRMYWYKEISFYRMRDFDVFLRLINFGVITVCFKIGVFKSGKRIGQIHDRGTDFSINLSHLNNLYEKIIL